MPNLLSMLSSLEWVKVVKLNTPFVDRSRTDRGSDYSPVKKYAAVRHADGCFSQLSLNNLQRQEEKNHNLPRPNQLTYQKYKDKTL